MINEQGGAGGRKSVLVMTAIRRRARWSRHAGLLVFNSFGTAPNAAIQAYLNEHGVLLFPLSGVSAPVGAALRASLP
jgi:hypothetical protein